MNRLYVGTLYHRRQAPTIHKFTYSVFLPYLNVSRLDESLRHLPGWGTGRFSPASFRRTDFLAPHDQDLSTVVKDKVNQELGVRPSGDIYLLANLRYFGYSINPIACYFCFDTSEELQAIVLEVTNTPWEERITYVVPCANGQADFEFHKAMHVSPFNPMDMTYHFACKAPNDKLNLRLQVSQASEPIFLASLALTAQPLTAKSAVAILWRYPHMTVKVAAGIYWQALKLWLKRTPVYAHPSKEHAL